ncbi:hypothetical protein B0H12DRAFT_595727 [Mycena haematopus]|nr:hypothetical protein B0H12DRAFT_595727 [Mycena haematopus]
MSHTQSLITERNESKPQRPDRVPHFDTEVLHWTNPTPNSPTLSATLLSAVLVSSVRCYRLDSLPENTAPDPIYYEPYELVGLSSSTLETCTLTSCLVLIPPACSHPTSGRPPHGQWRSCRIVTASSPRSQSRRSSDTLSESAAVHPALVIYRRCTSVVVALLGTFHPGKPVAYHTASRMWIRDLNRILLIVFLVGLLISSYKTVERKVLQFDDQHASRVLSHGAHEDVSKTEATMTSRKSIIGHGCVFIFSHLRVCAEAELREVGMKVLWVFSDGVDIVFDVSAIDSHECIPDLLEHCLVHFVEIPQLRVVQLACNSSCDRSGITLQKRS